MGALYGGIDLALRHGAVVQVEVDPETDKIVVIHPLVKWSHGPGQKAHPSRVYSFFHRKVTEVVEAQEESGILYGIDWDTIFVFKRGRKKAELIKSFACGAIFAGLRASRNYPHIVTPKLLRMRLRLGERVKKEAVWNRMEDEYLTIETTRRFFGLNSDEKDAAALALSMYLYKKPK